MPFVNPTTRRRLLGAALVLPLTSARVAFPQTLPLTPACGDKPTRTPSQTAGPYFTPNSPRRESLLEPGSKGERLVLAGFVVSQACRPVANAMLDFWHADETGEYDNSGYRWRGHLFSDAQGRFRLETIAPGIYPGRARHFHVRVQAPGRRTLTTQLYFPGEPGNRSDAIYRAELEMKIERRDGHQLAGFQFVVDA